MGCYQHQNNDPCAHLHAQSQDPVASNTGKELKPCPFCGDEPQQLNEFLKCCNCVVDIERWNNAWAHKQIAALEATNAENREYVVRWNNLADRIQKALKKEKRCLSCDDQIEEADCACFDQRDAYMVGQWFDELLQKLKTAEDKLAEFQRKIFAHQDKFECKEAPKA